MSSVDEVMIRIKATVITTPVIPAIVVSTCPVVFQNKNALLVLVVVVAIVVTVIFITISITFIIVTVAVISCEAKISRIGTKPEQDMEARISFILPQNSIERHPSAPFLLRLIPNRYLNICCHLFQELKGGKQSHLYVYQSCLLTHLMNVCHK